MSAIAYRDGTMAADTAGWFGGGEVMHFNNRKILRLGEALIGCSGQTDAIQWFLDWRRRQTRHDSPARPSDNPLAGCDFGAIEARPSGVLLHWSPMLVPTEMDVPYFAMGAPREFLLGALAAGASAERAVQLAIDLHTGAGGRVQVEHIGPPAMTFEERARLLHRLGEGVA